MTHAAATQLLTNAEVLEFIKSCDAADHSTHVHFSQHLRTVSFEITKYLTNPSTGVQMTSESAVKLAQKLRGLGLTKAEIVMIANSAPTSPVELYLMIEELGDRFNEEQVENMLGIIQEHVNVVKE
ncbi:HRDC-like protein [Chytriomyces sp. MP71]|nr:HRDC-like protein [Chytriomyces sp. MP71]